MLIYRWQYYLTRPHEVVAELYRETKWFIQRGSRGYADCDVWSLDGYLVRIMIPALKQLEKNKFGFPVGMTRKGWDTRLKQMRDGFRTAQDILDMKYKTPKECFKLERRMQRGLNVFTKHFLSLWD